MRVDIMAKFKNKGKREQLTYIIIALWVTFGIIGYICSTDFASLSAYFLSLTGFVGSYMVGESVRKSSETSIFSFKTPSSQREVMIYICVLLWAAVGIFGMIKGTSLVELATYFGSLTPFVAGAILGQTFKSEPTSTPTDNVEPS